MNRGPTIEDIKREAQARIFDVLAGLGVRDKPSASGYISMCNPVVKDRTPSFTIWLWPEAGAWKDHRADYPGGDRGDVIDLVSYLKGWWNYPKKGRAEALRWLTNELGLADIPAAQLERDRANSSREYAERQKARDEDLANKQGRAFATWLEASPHIAGTVVDTYLRGRGIVLEELPKGPRGGDRTPSILRCSGHHKHTESDSYFPCMMAACVNVEGEIKAVHRTWLDPLGAGKAPVVPVKKVWPAFNGLFIPLWRGDSGLSAREAAANGLRETLVLTEGIEDGLTAALAAPQHRTWAFISLGNLGNIVLPECCDGVIVHRQNEWENRQAVTAFERGKAALEAQGRQVVEVRAMYGKDLNDTQRGAA